jgi:hypothetical protein
MIFIPKRVIGRWNCSRMVSEASMIL